MEIPSAITINGNYNTITTQFKDLEIKFYEDGDYLVRIRNGKITRIETILVSTK